MVWFVVMVKVSGYGLGLGLGFKAYGLAFKARVKIHSYGLRL